ncbi:hypothetical protein BGZ54_002903 [Gamsiella multidivaricata]|nr:hypothetical protein BGZ54_002903 [Gamsiella multidivaricata]
MALLTTFKHLGRLSWTAEIEVRVDDVLHVLKSCTQLQAVTFQNARLVQGLSRSWARKSEEKPDLIKVDDEGWTNTSLRFLTWKDVILKLWVNFVGPKQVQHCTRQRPSKGQKGGGTAQPSSRYHV